MLQRMIQNVSAVHPFRVNLGNHETYDTANGIIAISARYRFSGMPYPKGSKDGKYIQRIYLGT